MQITISGRHLDVSEKLKDYTTEKTSKFDRYYDRARSVEVVFDKESLVHVCEIIVRADHHTTFVAKESHEDPYAALDATAKDIERQMTKHKEKHRNRKHPEGASE